MNMSGCDKLKNNNTWVLSSEKGNMTCVCVCAQKMTLVGGFKAYES